jgi:osmotically-inducible protein OsmY
LSGPLLAAALGVAVLAASGATLAQAAGTLRDDQAPRPEVVVTGTRLTDEALTLKVVQTLRADPYVFSDHISVVTENGVVKLQGIALDLSDLQRALRLARRAARGARVVSEIELVVADDGG